MAALLRSCHLVLALYDFEALLRIPLGTSGSSSFPIW